MIGVPRIKVVLLAATIVRFLHSIICRLATESILSVPRKGVVGVDIGSIHSANATTMEECSGTVAHHGHSITKLCRGEK